MLTLLIPAPDFQITRPVIGARAIYRGSSGRDQTSSEYGEPTTPGRDDE